MKLNVGLMAHSAMWEQLLQQEGVPFELADRDININTYSTLVVNRLLLNEERNTVEQYLNAGGAVLASAAHLIGVFGTTTRRERIEYLVADNDPVFPSVSFVDVSVDADIPREANSLRTEQNIYAAFAGPLGGGCAVLLPFDIAALMSDDRKANKNFYASRERLPSERVSLVSKGEIHHIVHDSLQYLHHARNLPYAHVWYFPDGKQNLFVFRVDSDKGSRNEIDELRHVAVENDVRMSWFLDVKSHEDWLYHFAFFAEQEIGVHCYEHQTYGTFDQNLKNILKARHKLDQAGVHSAGFTAPFGIWNSALARAIDKLGFEYSSEFSYVYDALPLYPSNRELTFYTPQIPIHPICIGSLRRAGYGENHMKEYFRRVIDEKLLRDEPLVFYHHPTHHCPEVVRFIFQYVEDKRIENMTMLEYARWWVKRLNYRPALLFNGTTLIVENNSVADDSLWLRIARPDKTVTLCRPSATMDLNTLSWNGQRAAATPPSDIRRIREFDPRRMLGDLFTRLTRKIAERKTNE